MDEETMANLIAADLLEENGFEEQSRLLRALSSEPEPNAVTICVSGPSAGLMCRTTQPSIDMRPLGTVHGDEITTYTRRQIVDDSGSVHYIYGPPATPTKTLMSILLLDYQRASY